MPTLSLVIPCYNEENTLAACVDRVLRLAGEDLRLELVIVDDCSTDQSLAIARQLAAAHPEVQVYSHARNQGKGAALRTGFLHASGDVVGIQDADDEYSPLEYTRLIQPILAGQADVVYGSRYLLRESRRVLSYWHTRMNRFLTSASNWFSDLDLTDMETCYKLFRRDVIQKIAPELRENRFGFEPEVTMLIARNGYRVYECAISYTPRSYAEGKKIGWRDGVRALYCIVHYGAAGAPAPVQWALSFCIGLLSSLGNLAVFMLLYAFGSGALAAVGIAFFAAAWINFRLCGWCFGAQKRTQRSKCMRYAGVVLLLAIDYGITIGLLGLHIPPAWSKLFAALCCLGGTFILRKKIFFNKNAELTKDPG